MRIVGRPLLEEFCLLHSDTRSQIDAWLCEVKEAEWKNLNDLKVRYPSSSVLDNGRVVFNIKGKKYRLLVRISLKNKIIRIEWVGTHAQYSKRKL